jgi:hypothetical protein
LVATICSGLNYHDWGPDVIESSRFATERNGSRREDGALERIPVALTHNLSVVMPAPGHFVPGVVPGTHVFRATKEGVGGRDLRAYTPVFAG